MLAVSLCFTFRAEAQRQVDVTTQTELQAAINNAEAGDQIVLADGQYLARHRLNSSTPGTAAMPVVVRAGNPHGATIVFRDASGIVEGFSVTHPHWTFEDLIVEGECDDHSRCEHAWHIAGDADHVVIRNNVARNFNAQIKANGVGMDRARVFPDHVLVEGNEFYNETVRMTDNPVTPIDVVGGRRWIVRANYIHDFAKGRGNGISYAAFLKGNGRDGLFECNIVACESLHRGQTRLGLSFGGGGSSPRGICEDQNCDIEHQNGIMRNNVVLHCPADVGIYINECMACSILHNTVYDSVGIHLRFATTQVVVEGNLVAGEIRDRDAATSMRMNNLVGVSNAEIDGLYGDPSGLRFFGGDPARLVDMGRSLPDVTHDFCGNQRDNAPDIGAVEFDGDTMCSNVLVHAGGGPPTGDAGTTPPDAGRLDAAQPMDDAGQPSQDAAAPATDSAARTDSGGNGDASPEEAPSSDGCGCRAPARRSTFTPGLALLIGGLLWRRRRR